MSRSADLRETIGRLLSAQKLAVLSTQEDGQPCGNLVAFAATEDLGQLLFATRSDGGKYRRILREPRVALLADDRSNREADFQEAVAITALGPARIVPADERPRLLERYLSRHPSLRSFASAPECVLLCIDVERYLVSGFQDVEELRLR